MRGALPTPLSQAVRRRCADRPTHRTLQPAIGKFSVIGRTPVMALKRRVSSESHLRPKGRRGNGARGLCAGGAAQLPPLPVLPRIPAETVGSHCGPKLTCALASISLLFARSASGRTRSPVKSFFAQRDAQLVASAFSAPLFSSVRYCRTVPPHEPNLLGVARPGFDPALGH
jgi:hypothetical protein